MTHLLEISNLSIDINGARVVEALSLAIDKGECLGIVGESGSGKSLTALAVLGLLPLAASVDAASAIRLVGTDITRLDDAAMRRFRGARVGIVFQDPMSCLNPFMKVGAQIVEAIRTHKPVSGADARRQAQNLLREVGIRDPERRFGAFPHELSGGQQQRVMIAMALSADPALLIADEPTTALDATVQHQILTLLKRLRAQRGMALMFISHDLGVVASIAERVAVMRHGRLVESGPVHDILAAPRHPYTRALIAARRRMVGGRTKGAGQAATTGGVVVEGLRIVYRAKHSLGRSFVAVDDVDLVIEPGQVMGLVGESGSGKSSIARALAGLARPDKGRIAMLGQEFTRQSWQIPRHLRGKRQIVFQNPTGALNPRLPISTQLAEPLNAIHGPTGQERVDRMIQLLAEVGLDESYLDRYPHEMSGGQKQRICIARALLSDPDVLICDEVVSSLDVTTQLQVLDLLASLRAKRGFSMLFIGHDLDVVAAVSDHIAVMHEGRIIETGTAADIIERPTNSYTRRLIDAMDAVRLPQDLSDDFHPGLLGHIETGVGATSFFAAG
ncbi:MAG: ABC transporter ATP-binding protein [Rhodobacteraceae bacterium]|nr:ABC transporter ATP-binding protein [Paracoccaceae bacterium]